MQILDPNPLLITDCIIAALRVQNSELEKERATLAQVRIQLELRLQELQLQPGGGAMQQQQLLRNGCGSSTGGVSARPTNL